MSEFPHAELTAIAEYFDDMAALLKAETYVVSAAICRRAIQRHQELSDRLVMDAANASVIIGNLRTRVAELEAR